MYEFSVQRQVPNHERGDWVNNYVTIILLLLVFFSQNKINRRQYTHPPTDAYTHCTRVWYTYVGPLHIFITLHRLHTTHTRSYLSPPDRADIIYYYILQYNIRGIYTCFQTRRGEERGTPRVRRPYCIGMRDYYHHYAAHPF